MSVAESDIGPSAAIEVVAISDAMGGEVRLDPARPMDGATKAAVRQAFLDHQILLFRRGAAMEPEAFLRFGQIFGTPKKQVLRYKWHQNIPQISVLDSTFYADGSTDVQAFRVEAWHTDDSYLAIPCDTTILHSMEIPERGGNTRFLNLYTAYETLPDAMKRRIEGLRVVHQYDTPRAKLRPRQRTPEEEAETPPVDHPLVRTHPGTGRKALYINPNRIDHVIGMGRAESDALLDELYRHADQPQFVYSHRWQVGDLLMWDNRCLMHSVVLDYPVGQPRRMMRMLLEGERPV